jgi:hypothetical protein
MIEQRGVSALTAVSLTAAASLKVFLSSRASSSSMASPSFLVSPLMMLFGPQSQRGTSLTISSHSRVAEDEG